MLLYGHQNCCDGDADNTGNNDFGHEDDGGGDAYEFMLVMAVVVAVRVMQ